MAKAGKPEPLSDSHEDVPFWRSKSLAEMSRTEWESLCDRCGRCCLIKLEDEDSGRYHFTNVACRLFDAAACGCQDYANRSSRVPDCVSLDVEAVHSLGWLPSTCAYRLVAEGRDLYWWHPLVSGSADTVHEAGVSVRGKVVALEDDIESEALPHFIVTWPNRLPPGARRIGRTKR